MSLGLQIQKGAPVAECEHCGEWIYYRTKHDPVQGGEVRQWVHAGTQRKSCGFEATPKVDNE